VADNVVDIKVKVNAETGDLEVINAKLKETAKAADQVKGSFTGLTGEAKSLLASLGLIATATGILSFFKSSVRGAEEQNEAWRRLKFTVESTGQSFESARTQAEGWVSAIAAGTRFSDGEAIDALEKLTRITGSLSQAQKASELAMGLQKASGRDLSATVALVTELLNGNERALKETSREFASVAGGAKNTQEALDLLSDTYGKAAFVNDGYQDSQKRLSNSFGALKDEIGNFIIGPATKVLEWARQIVISVDEVGLRIARTAAKIQAFAAFAATPLSPGAAWADLKARLKEIDAEALSQYQQLEAKKTAALVQGTDEKLHVTDAALKNQQDKEDKAAAEALRKKQENDQKLLDMESELDQKIAALDGSSLQDKIKAYDAEASANRAKNLALNQSDSERQAYLEKLEKYHQAQVKKSTADERFQRQSLAKDAISIGIQTLQTLNELGNSGSAAERARAKALLVLQQAVAIGWVWVAAAKQSAEFGNPGLVSALAYAQTALIVANTAKGIKQIDQAAAQEAASGGAGVRIAPDVPGITSTGGGPSVGVTGHGGGGGGGGTVITQHFSFSINFDQLTAENIRPLARAIADAIRNNQTDAVRMAIEANNAAVRNSGIAS
jgi:hypothetical protein